MTYEYQIIFDGLRIEYQPKHRFPGPNLALSGVVARVRIHQEKHSRRAFHATGRRVSRVRRALHLHVTPTHYA